MDKEKRGPNFTKTEMDLLIDIVLKFKYIVENKITDATTWKDKNEAWEKIAREFNAASGNFPRSTKMIRSKYDGIKKSIRKKCSLLHSEQTKTGGGPCPASLTSYEEKVLCLTPNTMIGLKSRFDNDSENAEPGPSNVSKWISLDDPEPTGSEDVIEHLDEDDYDLFQFLKESENLGVPEEPSPNIDKMTTERNRKRSHSAMVTDSNPTQKEKDSKKFIFKNKRTKSSEHSRASVENSELKNNILLLQQQLLTQEIEAKSEINKLTIENLRLDAEIKHLKIQKLEAHFSDE